MNVFFVFDDGSMLTPPLGGTILPGVTRASLLTLATDKGITVREERYSDRPVAGRRGERPPARGLRLRHRRRRHADRHGRAADGELQDRQRRPRRQAPRT